MTTNLASARNFLDKLPAGISGSGGHSATLRAACECVRLGLNDGEAMELLWEFNCRCQPPWTEKELVHKLKDARRKAGGAIRIFIKPKPSVRIIWKIERQSQPIIAAKPPILRPARDLDCPNLETVPPPRCVEHLTEVENQPVVVESQYPLPYLNPSGVLVIPFDSNIRFHWWKVGSMRLKEVLEWVIANSEGGGSARAASGSEFL